MVLEYLLRDLRDRVVRKIRVNDCIKMSAGRERSNICQSVETTDVTAVAVPRSVVGSRV